MGLTNIRIPNYTSDVLGVFDSDFRQVFQNARPMRARIKETVEMMKHPLETGATIIDHRIILPVEIEILVILLPDDYRSTYEQIRAYRRDGTKLMVQTKATTYLDMVITDIPHEEEPGMYNTISMGIKFEEAQYVQARYDTLPPSQVRDPANASTKQRGQQQTTEATDAQAARAGQESGSWIWRQTQ